MCNIFLTCQCGVQCWTTMNCCEELHPHNHQRFGERSAEAVIPGGIFFFNDWAHQLVNLPSPIDQVFMHMGQNLQDGKKVLCVSLNSPYSKRPPDHFGFLAITMA